MDCLEMQLSSAPSSRHVACSNNRDTNQTRKTTYKSKTQTVGYDGVKVRYDLYSKSALLSYGQVPTADRQAKAPILYIAQVACEAKSIFSD